MHNQRYATRRSQSTDKRSDIGGFLERWSTKGQTGGRPDLVPRFQVHVTRVNVTFAKAGDVPARPLPTQPCRSALSGENQKMPI